MQENESTFRDLGLSEPILRSLSDAGYERPSPIQLKSIPLLLEGHDLLGQAQTGTGKTAAFALPLLDRMDPTLKFPQMLVLAPTRELAIQVAEAFQSYSKYMNQLHVMPVYGGQSMGAQLKQLSRKPHIIVGTPGRVMDHVRRGSLVLDQLRALVLDEADEMLNMGFADDIEWIFEKTPSSRQTALFSATMPKEIRRVAQKYLTNPQEVKIQSATATTDTVEQAYWRVSGVHKLDALTRILEVENTDGLIIFVRTKNATVELSDKLEARGYASAALNGDMSQALRERTVEQLKQGKLDIVVATDVAARGLDVQRISHVINYDIPYDNESYVHRIGRTGRAGRSGKAILFVAPREMRMLRSIEKTTRKTITELKLPSREIVTARRIERLHESIAECLQEDLDFFVSVVEKIQTDLEVEPMRLAAGLLRLAQKDRPLQLSEEKFVPIDSGNGQEPRRNKRPAERRSRDRAQSDPSMTKFRIAVGRDQGVKPGNIVGAIANEAGIDSKFIGHIRLYDQYSTVDLPKSMSRDTLSKLRNIRLCGYPMRLENMTQPKNKS